MAPKRKSDGGGLGPHVLPLRGGRTGFVPDVRFLFIQFMVMLNARYTAAAAAAAGRHDGVNPGIKEGIRKRYNQLADAAGVFAQDVLAPWSRVEWLKAESGVASMVFGDDEIETILQRLAKMDGRDTSPGGA